MYQSIALDIAEKIVDGKYPVGPKFYGRSMLAGRYNVSPETIRRALFLLKDVDVVEITQGSGIHIVSVENAKNFVDRFKDIRTITQTKAKISEIIHKQNALQSELEENINALISFTDVYDSLASIVPFAIEITPKCKYIGKMVSELRFWQNTGATIIAIRRDDQIELSPGPYAVICDGDVFVMIGQNGTEKNVRSFLFG